jgi:hypothetical protein
VHLNAYRASLLSDFFGPEVKDVRIHVRIGCKTHAGIVVGRKKEDF